MKKLWFLCIFLYLTSFVFSENITLWYSWSGEEKKMMLANVAKYELLENVKVNVKFVPFHALNTKYMATAPSGKGPDIVVGPVDWIGQFMIKDLLEPLDTYVNKNEEKEFIKNIIDGCRYDGNLYGLPESYKLNALIYNKELIKFPPKTTNEMIKIGKKFYNEDESEYGIAFKFRSYYSNACWLYGFNGKMLDKNKNPTFDSEEHKNSLKFVKRLIVGKDKIAAEESDTELMMTLFKSGNVPMMINGSWAVKDLQNAGINFGVTRIPMISETGRWPKPLVGAEILMLSSKSKNKIDAFKLMKYLSSETSQVEGIKYGHLPSRKAIYDYKFFKEKKYDWARGFRKQAEVSVPMPSDIEMYISVWGNGRTLLRRALENEEDIDVFPKEVQRKAMNDIIEYRKKNTKK